MARRESEDEKLVHVSRGGHMSWCTNIAEHKLVLVPMSAKVLVELLETGSLAEEQILAIAREYLAQEQYHARCREREKLHHTCARDYVFANSDLLMELRAYPSQCHGISRSVPSREGPYGATETQSERSGPRSA